MDAIDRGAALITALGNRIIADDAYAYIEWDALALVISVSGTTIRMHGFTYSDDGLIAPTVPETLTAGDVFKELRTVTNRPDGKPWVAALMQIVRATAHVTLKFEWDDPKRWAVTPFNLAARREELRPTD